MAQAAGAISDHFFGFEWYYAWLAAFAIIGTAFAVGGPVVVVRDFLQRFGVWIVVAASIWLSYRLFATYSIQSYWNDDGAGGFPNFWQGVDIAVSLPVSWLPLVADYSRYRPPLRRRRLGDVHQLHRREHVVLRARRRLRARAPVRRPDNG